MCGILFHIGNEEINRDHPALTIINHRGPDSRGAKSFDCGKFRVGLGHCRLSIIDLSERGSQPMPYDSERYWICFNGEVFNYVELKAELEAKGCRFNSDCDTEIILAAYTVWGRKCLSKFNGMFSFALFDRKENTVFIARDRFGVKPLYYINNASGFTAASEIKQFTAMKGFKAEADMLNLYHFINSADFSFSETSLWKDVMELAPGSEIFIDLNKWQPGDKLEISRWYEIPSDINRKISFEDAVAEFRRILDDAVRIRLRADVPIGFLLSGGLDSSTLVGLAHKLYAGKSVSLKTYSSCYGNDSIDESVYIKAVNEFNGAESFLHYPQPQDLQDNLDKVIWHNDIPVVHGSVIPHFLIYKSIMQENDSRIVILEGQGADEILCGYGDFHWAALNENFRSGNLPSFIRHFTNFQDIKSEPLKIVLRKFFRMNMPSLVKYPANPLLDMSSFDGVGTKIPSIPIRREAVSVEALHKNRMQILRYILHNVDRNSMSQSRETRVPFLDYRLVEFCLSLPVQYKISDGITKKVLRDAVADVLPPLVKNRTDKQGYSSPVARWAKKEMAPFFKDAAQNLKSLPFVNKKALEEAVKKIENPKVPFNPALWRLITVARWQDIFKVRI